MLHKLVLRQVLKHLNTTEITDLPEHFQVLLKIISDTYDHYEKDRAMLERSIDLSSSEMIELNQKLRTESERLNEAQRIAHLGSWMWDLKNNVKIRSSEFYRIFEMSPREFPNDHDEFLATLVHEEDRQLLNNALKHCLIDHKPLQCEIRIITKSQSIKTIYVQGQILEDDIGEVEKIYGTIQDISERKIVMEELSDKYAQLKKTNSELDKFVYSASHDLRAPLSSMMGILGITEEETIDPFVLEHIQMLKDNIKRLDGFIVDILDYSRNSRLEVKKEKIDFKDMLSTITRNLKYMGKQGKEVNIFWDIKEHKSFATDKSRLNIILNNLISNAIRYQNPLAEEPFVNIRVNTSDTETNIIVRDNGIGISKELHAKIFDMFFRISDESVGSGLGLYIVKEAVGKLNGKIEVDSELGKGTSFIIQFPNVNAN
jgi:signal transduction histidine kinase